MESFSLFSERGLSSLDLVHYSRGISLLHATRKLWPYSSLRHPVPNLLDLKHFPIQEGCTDTLRAITGRSPPSRQAFRHILGDEFRGFFFFRRFDGGPCDHLLFFRETLESEHHGDYFVDQKVRERKVRDHQFSVHNLFRYQRLQNLVAAAPRIFSGDVESVRTVELSLAILVRFCRHVTVRVINVRRAVLRWWLPAHNHPARHSVRLVAVTIADAFVAAFIAPEITHANELRLSPNDLKSWIAKLIFAEHPRKAFLELWRTLTTLPNYRWHRRSLA